MTSPYLPNRTKNALAIRCSGATMPMGELLLRVELVLQRVLQLFTLQLSTSTPSKNRTSETESASKVFELSQTLRQQWLTADYNAKRRILEIICLNCRLDGATLVPEMRKPFDVVAEGLVSEKSRHRCI